MGTIPYVPSYLRASPSLIWPVTSVLDFGAIGNGSADDYPAITAALQALAAKGGGTLVFPNDRDFRIATPGVHGIHLARRSNITIMMGERSRLVMDNMVDGLAVSHGIFVEGPCENISLIGVHVTYAALSASRQTWAPIYFLGANVGTGDEGTGGWYRGEIGGERPDLIAAGAIANVRLENVTVSNSPSVGVALVGVDRVVGRNIAVRETWADGIYCRMHRRVSIDGYYGYRVGDDGLSMGSEESSYDLADIENDFHGEGSTFSNIVIEGQQPDPVPAGSVVLLGVKDTTISNVVCIDRFRGLRIEAGTHHTLGYPGLNINFVANRRVTIGNMSFDRCTQDIAFVCLEANAGTDEKWWRHSLTIADVVGMNGGAAIDIYGPGIPLNGGTPWPIFGGVTFSNMKFTNYANVAQTFIGMVDCVFDGFETDSTVSIQGFVPYTIDPDLLDADDAPMFLENRTVFRNFKGSTITVQGLKRCWFDGLESTQALRDGIVFLNCADIEIGTVRVRYPNRIDDPIANGGLTFDEFCKRCSVQLVEVQQDGNDIHAMGLRGTGQNRVACVRVKTSQDVDAPYVTTVSDRAWIAGKLSQVGRVEWLHSGGDGAWGARDFPDPPVVTTHGDADVQLYIEGDARFHRIVYPLGANRTWTLYDARATIGDRIEVVRDAALGGDYSIAFQGLAPEVLPAPQSDAYTAFSVTGSAGGILTSILVNETLELLDGSVAWAVSDEATTAAIAQSINDGASGFIATATQKLVFLRAPVGSRLDYNNATVDQAATGNLLLAYGMIPRMTGGNDAASAGEVTALSSFLILGDSETYHGTIASITVDMGSDGGVKELLAAPLTWGPDSNRTAYLLAEACMDNYASHGFTVASSRNGVIVKAPPGFGATANGWEVVVTPTADVTTYDVKPMGGGRDPDPVSGSEPVPYAIVTTTPGAAFHAVFEFAATGWTLVSLAYDRPRYPNGRPLFDSSNRLLSLNGDPIVDEFKNLKYASGAVLGWDSGRLGIGSVPPASSSADGVAGMVTWDPGYLYVCTATNTWKRIALSSF